MIRQNENTSRSIILTLLLLVLTATTYAASGFTLVIDAGHGGHDAGAKGSFSYEKNINLRVALAFGKYVEKNCPDVKVIYTRKTDVFVPLHKRADIANKNHADVFISIHTNALPAGRIARGTETYTMGIRRSNEKLSAAQRENAVITYENDYKQHYEGYDPNSPESAILFEFIHDKNMAKSVELARLVQKNVCSTASRPNKGVKQDVFLVLRETSMPACLLELGFITTPDEERLLNDDTAIDNIARGIYNAFAQYKNDNHTGFTVPFEAKGGNEVKIPSIVPPSYKGDKPAPRAQKRVRKVEPQQEDKTAETEKKAPETEKNDAETEKTADEAVKIVADNDRRQQDAPKHNADTPVFKVQIMASGSEIAAGSARFKGQTEVDCYREGGMFKYTVGSSVDYNEINRLRQSLAETFPGCFVVAFMGSEKINVSEAIRIFKTHRTR